MILVIAPMKQVHRVQSVGHRYYLLLISSRPSLPKPSHCVRGFPLIGIAMASSTSRPNVAEYEVRTTVGLVAGKPVATSGSRNESQMVKHVVSAVISSDLKRKSHSFSPDETICWKPLWYAFRGASLSAAQTFDSEVGSAMVV